MIGKDVKSGDLIGARRKGRRTRTGSGEF